MINSLCGSMGSLRGSEITTTASSSKQPPPSPTASVSESNVIASELDHNNQSTPGSAINGIKFDVDIDVEVLSPDNSIWETLFADQIDSGTDFMISSPRRDFMTCSPRRDYMISSPRRDYMVSSPRRDYMVSSPKRDYMVSSPKREYVISSPKREYMLTYSPKRDYLVASSPKREYLITSSPKRAGTNSICGHNYGYIHGMNGHSIHGNYNPQPPCNSHQIGGHKGKSQSPLHKVCSSSCSPQYVHGESLALPTMDSFLDEYQRESYPVYTTMRTSGIDCSPQAFEVPAASTLPSLLECLSMPESRFCGAMSDTTLAAGLQMDREVDLYQINHLSATGLRARQQEQQQQRELDHSLLGPVIAKTEQSEAPYHVLLGPILAEPDQQEQDSGLQLVHLLLACAEAVAKDDYLAARRYLHHLNRVVSPVGDSMQRVAACFTDALAARLTATLTSASASAPSPSSSPRPPSHDVLKLYQIVYQACPYIKFAHFTANQAIFEAFEGEERVHIIDLDIHQGYQWPAFMQALAARPGGPPFLRITGVGHPAESVRETGCQLADLAHSLRVPFAFHAVTEPLEALQPGMLHRRVGEALAVNAVNRLHRVAAPALGALLGMIRDQAPSIVTLVEQEASHNGPHFLGRFLEALHYYSAIFDSLDATFPADSVERARVEQYLFSPEIRNIVACEGGDRMERHERLERWRKMMEGKGFKGVALSANALNQSNILLGLYSCDGYRLTEDKGCLLLGWQDRAILAASAWRC